MSPILDESQKMELLIVGAGAIGSVYGYLASRASLAGGCRITYLVKPKHRAELLQGRRLYAWKGKRAEAVNFSEFGVISSFEEVAAKKFDAVLITLPSDKFRAEGWLDELLRAAGPTRIWSLQPSSEDQELLRAKMAVHFGPAGPANIVFGRIPIIAYLAPMPGEDFQEPGYAYIVPPFAKAIWSSPTKDAAEEASVLFQHGGLPSKTAPEDFVPNLTPEALLRCVVAGLERCGWSFDRFKHGENIHLAAGAMREMTAIQARALGVPDSSATMVGRLVASPFGIRNALSLVSKLMPFDFESFLRVHFTKVEGQMHLNLDETIRRGKSLRLSTTNLVLLRGRARKDA